MTTEEKNSRGGNINIVAEGIAGFNGRLDGVSFPADGSGVQIRGYHPCSPTTGANTNNTNIVLGRGIAGMTGDITGGVQFNRARSGDPPPTIPPPTTPPTIPSPTIPSQTRPPQTMHNNINIVGGNGFAGLQGNINGGVYFG